ncbi:MAG: discoidin domain-containing protein, partial [Planctomycetota bacterium]
MASKTADGDSTLQAASRSGEQDPWWQVDLRGQCELDRIVIFNRTDARAERTANIRVLTASKPGKFTQIYQHDGTTFYGVKEDKPLVVNLEGKGITARIVRLQIPGKCSFALDEIEVYAADNPKKNVALNKP